MLEPKVDLYTVAIPPPRDRDWRENDFTSNPQSMCSCSYQLIYSVTWQFQNGNTIKPKISNSFGSFLNFDFLIDMSYIHLSEDYRRQRRMWNTVLHHAEWSVILTATYIYD